MLHYMLGLLLFSGSLTTDVTELQSRWLDVFLISTVGVLISVAFVGTCVFLILENMHVFGSQADAPDSTQVRDTASPLPGRHNTSYTNTDTLTARRTSPFPPRTSSSPSSSPPSCRPPTPCPSSAS
jgi:hypothetical protein